MVKWVAVLVFGRFRVQISARISNNPTEVFYLFASVQPDKNWNITKF